MKVMSEDSEGCLRVNVNNAIHMLCALLTVSSLFSSIFLLIVYEISKARLLELRHRSIKYPKRTISFAFHSTHRHDFI